MYTLIFLSIVGIMPRSSNYIHDWRALATFEETGVKTTAPGYKSGKQLCEEAAKELHLKPDSYKCVRSR